MKHVMVEGQKHSFGGPSNPSGRKLRLTTSDPAVATVEQVGPNIVITAVGPGTARVGFGAFGGPLEERGVQVGPVNKQEATPRVKPTNKGDAPWPEDLPASSSGVPVDEAGTPTPPNTATVPADQTKQESSGVSTTKN